MDSMQIDAFLLSAEYLSFSEAAKALFTTQPSISRKVSALEEEVGKKLFIRKQNKIQLTRAGQILYDEFTQLKFFAETALERAKGQEDIVVAKLKIGCMDIYDYGICLPPEVLSAFSAEYPEVQLTLLYSTLGNIRTAFLQDEIDVAITFGWDLEQVPGISITKLYTSSPCFIIGRQNPLASKIESGDFDIKDLAFERFYAISSIESPGRLAEIQNCCLQYGFLPNEVVYCQNNRSMMECIYQGLGVSIVDMNIREASHPDFLTIPIDNYRSVDLVAARKEKTKNVLAEAFVDFLEDFHAHHISNE